LQAFIYTEINYLHASISTSLHIEINCLPWIWGLLVSMLRWKIWGMAADTVEVGSAGEEVEAPVRKSPKQVRTLEVALGRKSAAAVAVTMTRKSKAVTMQAWTSSCRCAGCPRDLFLLCRSRAALCSPPAPDLLPWEHHEVGMAGTGSPQACSALHHGRGKRESEQKNGARRREEGDGGAPLHSRSTGSIKRNEAPQCGCRPVSNDLKMALETILFSLR
jgi:hypothetical protein